MNVGHFSILVLTSCRVKHGPSYRLQVTAGWLLSGLMAVGQTGCDIWSLLGSI